MKRELGIARCGLACCLCSENEKCFGCNSNDPQFPWCPAHDWCQNRNCSLGKGLGHCYDCPKTDCRIGLLGDKMKALAFTEFARRYGENTLLDCLERNEKSGIVYHREGILGDYDDFDDVEKLMDFIKTGQR